MASPSKPGRPAHSVDVITARGQLGGTSIPSPGRRMRILHLAKYYWPRSGGMERVVQDLAEGASLLGHQVEVVAVQGFGRGAGTSRHRTPVTRAC